MPLSGARIRASESWLGTTKNVTVYRGHARFTGRDTVQVGDESLQAEKIFINVGGRAFIPPVGGLDDCAGSAGTGERALGVSVDAALRAGIFKASGSIDPIGFGDERERGLPRPWSSSR